MFDREPYRNGTVVSVLGTYKCIGQVCDHTDSFAGRRYEVMVLESDLFEEGKVQTIVEDLLTPLKNYRPRDRD